MPGRSSRRRAPPTAYRTQSGSCPENRDNLFDITEPAKLDNLMRAQDYAARFVAGASGEKGGSLSGTVFGDIGSVAGWAGVLGKAGELASEVWDAFSTVVLNTAEAYEFDRGACALPLEGNVRGQKSPQEAPMHSSIRPQD